MKRKIIIELKHNKKLEEGFLAGLAANSSDTASSSADLAPNIKGFSPDLAFSPVAVPLELDSNMGADTNIDSDEEENIFDTSSNTQFEYALSESTYLVRGEVDEKDLDSFEQDALSKRNVVAVFSDPSIEPTIICPGSPPLGTDKTVEKLLNTARLHRCKANGKGVRVAIVDTGVNMQYLASKGKTPQFDAAGSWKPSSSNVVPGSAPVGHGTMCAFDVCIAAPECTILDVALLTTRRRGGTVMEGFLSDAILAYRHLINLQINISPRPGVNKSLVVNNSWGMFHPSWDYPVGHPGNYSDNPNHPFNRIVRSLERCGADILFAAGNCGSDCPDGRCQNVTTRTIYGANSSPYVLTVAGVDTSKKRVGYSSKGPGRLTNRKPDVSGYTHFAGSGVYSADGGTSAACPVVAGLVAAVRTKRPLVPNVSFTRPAAIRNLIRSTCTDLGASGYDYATGFGVVNGSSVANKLKCPLIWVDICKRFPRLCWHWKFCKRYPKLCRMIPRIPGPRDIRLPRQDADIEQSFHLNAEPSMEDFAQLFFNNEILSLEELDAVELGLSNELVSQSLGDCNCSKHSE